MTQLSLFDALHAPPVRLAVNGDGPVVQGDADEELQLRHPRMAWDRARIQLHRHHGGRWMWSASWHCDGCGCGYQVGEKWGRFAETRDDALFYARQEIAERVGARQGSDARAILDWLEGLQ